MKAINRRLGVFQQRPTGLVIRRPHVHAITQYRITLFGCEQMQTRLGCFLVAPWHHRQHARILWITQIGHDGHIQLVAFLQADLVHANVRDDTLGIDHQRLAVSQLILHDETHRVRGDAQTPGHFGFVGADEHLQNVLLEAIRVAGVLAFEGRHEIMAMMTLGAAMKDRLITKESGLSQDFEIADDAHFANVESGFQTGRLDVFATWTATGFGPAPRNLDAVSFGQAVIAGDGDAFGKIDVNGEVGHGRPWQEEGEIDSLPIPQLRLV